MLVSNSRTWFGLQFEVLFSNPILIIIDSTNLFSWSIRNVIALMKASKAAVEEIDEAVEETQNKVKERRCFFFFLFIFYFLFCFVFAFGLVYFCKLIRSWKGYFFKTSRSICWGFRLEERCKPKVCLLFFFFFFFFFEVFRIDTALFRWSTTLAWDVTYESRPGPEPGLSQKLMKMFFKVENNSLELTRIFKENILTDCEREKKV